MLVITLFFVSCKSNCDCCLLNDDFLIDEIFSPPFIIGHVIVAFTVSSSFSFIDELKSSFSDLDIFIEAVGESLDRSILRLSNQGYLNLKVQEKSLRN